MHRFRTRKRANSSKCEEDTYSTWSSQRSVSPLESGETKASQKPPIAPASPVSEVSSSRNIALPVTESSDDLYGLTPVQSKTNVYEIEHQKPREATLEKKRSSISVKKLAFRLGSRLSSPPKDLKVVTQGKVLQKPRPGTRSTTNVSPYASTSTETSNDQSRETLPPQQITERPLPSGTYSVADSISPVSATHAEVNSHQTGPPVVNGSPETIVSAPANPVIHVNGTTQIRDFQPDGDSPTLPDQRNGAEPMDKPLPNAPVAHPPDFGLPPDVGASADHNLAKLLPPIQASTDLANSIDEKLTSMQGQSFRPTLKDELEATQQKLAQLFESQAMLRERYNTEKDKSYKLDEAHQMTHTRIHSLERSTREMNDELRRLYEYVGSLERANKELRGGIRISNEGNMYMARDDHGSVPSTRPVSASPPMSEIQPLRPNIPPPIPKKADRRSIRQGDDESPISRTNSHEPAPAPAAEDISYWRVGDITTIAEAPSGTGTPRPLQEHRRSRSMTDDILRKVNFEQAPPQLTRPGRSSSVRANEGAPQKVVAIPPPAPSVTSSRPEVKGFPQTSYAPVASSPYAAYTDYDSYPLDESSPLTPVPTRIHQGHVAAPSTVFDRPATASRTISYGGMASREPNGYGHGHGPYGMTNGYADHRASAMPAEMNGKAKAMNGYANGYTPAPYWPEYVEEEPMPDLRRQSTIKARPPQPPAAAQRSMTYPNNQGADLTRRRSPPSIQSSNYSADHTSSTEDGYDNRTVSRAPSERGRAQTHSSSSGSASRRRKLKLKSSLELLPNCTKKEIALDANRQAAIVGKPISVTSNFIESRGFALYRFINPQPVSRDMLSYELERLRPSMSTSKVMISEPTTLRVTFPKAMKGVEGTVGMYDSVSEMWLNPHALKKSEASTQVKMARAVLR